MVEPTLPLQLLYILRPLGLNHSVVACATQIPLGKGRKAPRNGVRVWMYYYNNTDDQHNNSLLLRTIAVATSRLVDDNPSDVDR